jgi:hypothetical protein
MILQNHRRLPGSLFNVKIADLGSFEAGYWKLISKEQTKTLSLIFSSTKKQKIVNTIIACTESKYIFVIITLQKNIHFVIQSL